MERERKAKRGKIQEVEDEIGFGHNVRGWAPTIVVVVMVARRVHRRAASIGGKE